MNNNGCGCLTISGCLITIIILAILAIVGLFVNAGLAILFTIIFLIVGILRYLLKIL